MTHFRLRWFPLGGHVHVGVWTGTEAETTHGCNGRLVFREDEWEQFRRTFERGANLPGLGRAVEFVRETNLGITEEAPL